MVAPIGALLNGTCWMLYNLAGDSVDTLVDRLVSKSTRYALVWVLFMGVALLPGTVMMLFWGEQLKSPHRLLKAFSPSSLTFSLSRFHISSFWFLVSILCLLALHGS